jgi:hypothetical protein
VKVLSELRYADGDRVICNSSTVHNLDSETPRGRPYIELQRRISDEICKYFNCENRAAPADKTAPYDGLLYRYNHMVAVAEIKSRNLSKCKLEQWGTYLISESKIDDNLERAKVWRVPFLIFAYLIHSDTLVFWKISDPAGQILCDFEVRETETKETVNGGRIFRMNAYISLDQMEVLPISINPAPSP